MNFAKKPQSRLDKGELRRQQVLDAAAECFRRNGFHGTSIARISRVADMSPGHIYHYFVNKEAIVEAIAEREQDEFVELMNQLEQDQQGGDLATRLMRQTAEIVARNKESANVGLQLELAAEAARNPAVAKILEASHLKVRQEFLDVIKRVGVPKGMSDEELQLRTDMLNTVFRGLMLRSVVERPQDQAASVRLINELIQMLLGDRT